MSDYLKGLILTTLGVVILSFDGLLIRLISAESFDLLFWRGLLLSPAVIVLLMLQKSKASWWPHDAAALRSSALMAITTITFILAINLSSVANVLVIISSQPLFAAVFGWLLLKEKPAPVTWLAIVVCLLGIGWVLWDSWGGAHWLGDMLALACCITLSAKFVNDRAVSHRDMTPALISAGLVVAFISYFAGDPMALSGDDWGYMIALCLIINPLAFFLITLGPMRIPAAEVGMLMLLETAAGPLWVWLVLSEEPTSAALQGGTVVIATLLLHSIYQWRKSKLQLA